MLRVSDECCKERKQAKLIILQHPTDYTEER